MDEFVSKSQKKRDAEALTKLGAELVELKVSVLDTFPLTENLYLAIIEAKRITSFSAKKRQIHLIGKLLRAQDIEAIKETYNNLLSESSAQSADFHAIEIWRDRLIQGDNQVLSEFIAEFQPEDIQFLRQLIKKAVQEQAQSQNKTAAKALFRYLRTCIS